MHRTRPADPAPHRVEAAFKVPFGDPDHDPIWLYQSFRLANQVALVNVAGLAAILLSVIPLYLATRLSSGVVAARG